VEYLQVEGSGPASSRPVVMEMRTVTGLSDVGVGKGMGVDRPKGSMFAFDVPGPKRSRTPKCR
jgi:hypothetical protein